MEHFDRVALTLEPGEEGTVVGQERGRGAGRDRRTKKWVGKGRKEAGEKSVEGGDERKWRKEEMSQGRELILSYFMSHQTRSI